MASLHDTLTVGCEGQGRTFKVDQIDSAKNPQMNGRKVISLMNLETSFWPEQGKISRIYAEISYELYSLDITAVVENACFKITLPKGWDVQETIIGDLSLLKLLGPDRNTKMKIRCNTSAEPYVQFERESHIRSTTPSFFSKKEGAEQHPLYLAAIKAKHEKTESSRNKLLFHFCDFLSSLDYEGLFFYESIKHLIVLGFEKEAMQLFSQLNQPKNCLDNWDDAGKMKDWSDHLLKLKTLDEQQSDKLLPLKDYVNKYRALNLIKEGREPEAFDVVSKIQNIGIRCEAIKEGVEQWVHEGKDEIAFKWAEKIEDSVSGRETFILAVKIHNSLVHRKIELLNSLLEQALNTKQGHMLYIGDLMRKSIKLAINLGLDDVAMKCFQFVRPRLFTHELPRYYLLGARKLIQSGQVEKGQEWLGRAEECKECRIGIKTANLALAWLKAGDPVKASEYLPIVKEENDVLNLAARATKWSLKKGEVLEAKKWIARSTKINDRPAIIAMRYLAATQGIEAAAAFISETKQADHQEVSKYFALELFLWGMNASESASRFKFVS